MTGGRVGWPGAHASITSATVEQREYTTFANLIAVFQSIRGQSIVFRCEGSTFDSGHNDGQAGLRLSLHAPHQRSANDAGADTQQK
ncbi:hypothetical protein BH10CHL1_BH10CHL1_48350 [soil metagenome]